MAPEVLFEPAPTPQQPADEPTSTPSALAAEPALAARELADEQATSASSIAAPAAVATDAPTTADVPDATPVEAKTPAAEPARAVAALSGGDDDNLPELQPRRRRWLLPLGAAAALALGVVGLRQLDRAPTPTPAELARPVNAASKPVVQPAAATPKSDDDGDAPNTDTAAVPDPSLAQPQALNGQGDEAKPAGATPSAAAPSTPVTSAAAPADSAAPVATGSPIHINFDSDPPGARLFWKGKEVGTTPFVLEFQPGERHAYELGLPGYTTRKVVIDGSKTDISIGLRPDPAAPKSATRRK